MESSKPYVSAEPVDLLELQSNVPFQEGLAQFATFLDWINRNYRNGIVQIEDVQGKI